MFLQHLVTFRIVKDEDFDLYKKLVIGSAWRKQMPKLAVSLGLGDKIPGIFVIILPSVVVSIFILTYVICFVVWIVNDSLSNAADSKN